MLVVIAILGIVTLAVAPEILNSLEVRNLENSVRDVLNSLERAKFQSVRTKLNHRVRFDNSDGPWKYVIERETSPGTWEQMPRSISKTIPDTFVTTINLPDADTSVEFSSLGFIANFEQDKNSIVLQSDKLKQMNQPDLRSVIFFRGGSMKYLSTSS